MKSFVYDTCNFSYVVCRCMSFSYDTPQKVCFLSHFNSNSARNEINSCLLHSRNMTYYERIGSGPKTQGCQFPFLWKNKLYYECVEIDNQEMCSNTNGFHQPISWTECPGMKKGNLSLSQFKPYHMIIIFTLF